MIWILTLLVLLIDIGSKLIIHRYISVGESIELIRNFFNLTYVRNTGVAWSIFENKMILIIIVSALIITIMIGYIYKERPKESILKIAYALILGGAIGNFLNRIVYGYVIDFIDIRIFGYNYPIFNLADTFIVIGVIILIIFTWRHSDDRGNSRRK